MAKCVCSGAKIKCSFGAGPKSMMVLPLNRTLTANTKPIANILDIIPFVNIPAFGQCKSPANPMNWKMAGPVPVFVPSTQSAHEIVQGYPGMWHDHSALTVASLVTSSEFHV